MRIIKEFRPADLVTVPNLLSFLRLALVPGFVVAYCRGAEGLAAIFVLISTLTDFFDGFLARLLGQVTELGKLLDPVADKLTQVALALCLASRYRQMLWVFFLLLVKEGYMLFMGLAKLRQGKRLDGALWFGKVSTAVVFAVMLALLVLPLPQQIAGALIWISMAFLTFSLVMYGGEYAKM